MSLFLNGCESKKQTEIVKVKIPNYLLQVPYVDTNRSIKSDVDISLFMIDLYDGYKQCVINLESIKRINDDK